MGRKKRKADAVRIFCYYCERDFATEHELVHHQKEKHLRCPVCFKRMVSMSGLVVHASQVHKRTVSTVPNAIDGREDPNVDVFGMHGIPPDAGSSTQAAKRHQKRNASESIPDKAALGFSSVTQVPDAPPPSLAPAPSAYAYPAPYPQPTVTGQPPTGQIVSYPPAIHGYAPDYYPPQSMYSAAYAQPYAPPVHASNLAPPVATPGWTVKPRGTAHVASGLPNRDRAAQPKAYPSASTLNGKDGTATPTANSASSINQAPHPQHAKPSVVIVFDRDDVCMEELRAELPQYRSSTAGTKERQSTTSPTSVELKAIEVPTSTNK